jgi:putative glycosyltransferase (TIGR04348 family)
MSGPASAPARSRLDAVRISLVTPAPSGTHTGNRVTALRWARILRALGHRVRVEREYGERDCDVLIALHARRSRPSIERFRERHPDGALIIALTGTDLYGDLVTDPGVGRTLERASRLVLLQPMGLDALPHAVRGRARVIYQSTRTPAAAAPNRGTFDVCVLAHLRDVKDPLRAAFAARDLPPSSRIRVLHAGAALTDDMGRIARAEMRANPRYRWLGEIPRWKALRLLARSRVMVLSSRMEGGANALSEALAASVPVLVSRIPGSLGILGPDYPGTYPVGDTRALADLLSKAETDTDFYRSLLARCAALRPLTEPARERAAWAALLADLGAAQPERAGVRAS